MAGRPRLLTPLLVDRAADLRRDGHSVAAIASALAVSKRTTQRALARGRDEPPRVKAVTAPPPEGATEASLAAEIARAAANDWRAAAWLLERVAPERWASPSRRLEVVAAPRPDDPLAEVDELARRRRERQPRR